MQRAEIIVVGGGLFGPAIAYGLARSGIDVALLDEGDDALRAARGNFGLVWVQSKGMGFQRYADWSRESAQLWTDFAAELAEATGIALAHRNRGGLALLLGEAEVEQRRTEIALMKQQAGPTGFDCEIVDRREVQAMLPRLRLGAEVAGASFCPHDGDVNPLFLLRALHAGFAGAGGRYFPESGVRAVAHDGAAFVLETAGGRFAAEKIVLAAGHGIKPLAAMLGMDVPIHPERGQIIVTERLQPLFDMPVSMTRQTNEGSLQLGNSQEEVGLDDGTTLAVTQRIAARAVRAFPQLASVRMVRTWGCLRVLTPDKCAIYDESPEYPGAYVATSHSGVTLAAINARHVARWIATGETEPGFAQFSLRRFAERRDVQKTA